MSTLQKQYQYNKSGKQAVENSLQPKNVEKNPISNIKPLQPKPATPMTPKHGSNVDI